jgi:hypothetical protein
MKKTNAEIQREYKERRRSAGYKLKAYWVLDKEGDLKISKSAFIKKLGSLLNDCGKTKSTKLYADILALVRGQM